VIYEDLSAGLRAKRVFEHLGCLLDFEMGFELTLLRADILSESDFTQRTAQEAKAADILFLSGHGQRELSAAVKQWFLHWLAYRAGQPRALAVSFDANAGDIPGMLSTLHLLESAARLADVDVFVHWESPTGQKDFPIEQTQSVTKTRVDVREEPPRQFGGPSCQHWGINE
jgi:hypothetical protein